MKAWLKGGIIGGAIGLIVFILSYLITSFAEFMGFIHTKTFVIVFVDRIIYGILPCGSMRTLCMIMGPIILILEYAVIGIIIGLIISAIKSSKK